jgi:hypothetical protein
MWKDRCRVMDDDGAHQAVEDYFVHGLHLRSELALPELRRNGRPIPDGPTIDIRLGPAGTRLDAPRHVGPAFQVGRDDYLLEIERVARFRVRNGTEIVVDPDAGGASRDVRLFLLGTAFGALCHQRSLLPLHASAIEVDGRCVAFAGPSRTGKSTLAAHYGSRGYRILGDDLCVLSFDGLDPPLAWPGAPRIKLWRDAVVALGRDPKGLDRVREGLEKYHLPLDAGAADGALPLARIYFLHEARLPGQEAIERLAGAAAFDCVLNNTYRRHLVAQMGRAPIHFTQCSTLMRHVPVFAVGRRWGFASFAEQAEELERHFATSAE